MALSPKIKKDEDRRSLMRKYTLPTKTRAIILFDSEDDELFAFLHDAADVLGFSIISIKNPEWSTEKITGADAVVSDVSGSLDVVSLMHAWVVPIAHTSVDLAPSLVEFDPMRFEGNAFLVKTQNPFAYLEKILRFLECSSYPGDKNVLIKNVIRTF